MYYDMGERGPTRTGPLPLAPALPPDQVRRTAAARKARPLGVAPQEDVEAATARAWDALGFAGGEDDLDDFVAGSDEDEVNVADW